MHPTTSQLCVRGSRLTALLGTASLLTLAQAERVHAAEMVAQAEEIPETVLITGSLIRGTAAVGVPVVNLSPQDFAMTGTLTASDLFRTIPQFNVNPGPVATQAANNERGTRVNLRQLDTGSAPRSLMMIDGMRYPQQGNGLCQIDPSIIPAFAIERIDLLLDGASATYGSDAIGGVINIILKRNFDGAMVEAGWKYGKGGNTQYLASGMWGRTWDGGQVTMSYSWFDIAPTHGNFHSKFTYDHRPWGFDDRRPIGSSMPGTISTGGQNGQTMPDPNNPNVPDSEPELSRQYRDQLHQLLRHPARHRRRLGPRCDRLRPADAGQRPDAGLGSLCQCRKRRHQRHAQCLQPVRHHLLQRGGPIHRRRDHSRSAADQQCLVLRRRHLGHAPVELHLQ